MGGAGCRVIRGRGLARLTTRPTTSILFVCCLLSLQSCQSIHDNPSDLSHVSYTFHRNTSSEEFGQYQCPSDKPFRCKETLELGPNGSFIPLCIPQSYVRDGYYDCVYPYLGGPSEIGLILDSSDEQTTEAFYLSVALGIVGLGAVVLFYGLFMLVWTTMRQYQTEHPEPQSKVVKISKKSFIGSGPRGPNQRSGP